MRGLLTLGIMFTALALSGCAPHGDEPTTTAPPTRPLTTVPAPSPAVSTASPIPPEVSSCEDLIPQSEAALLYASGYSPSQRDKSSDKLTGLFVENGGVSCFWFHPDHMDTFPVFAFSEISPQQAEEAQAYLYESAYVRKADQNGYVVVADEYWGSLPGVYLFGDGVWFHAMNLEDAFLIVDTVSQNSH